MKNTALTRCILTLSAILFTVHAQTVSGADGPVVRPDLEQKARASIASGLEWLAELQNEKGGWSDDCFPALTALPLWAFARSGHPQKDEIVSRAVDYIVEYQIDSGLYEGAIYQVIVGEKGGGLPNYNTAVCLAALAEVEDPGVAPVILAGRTFLARTQYLGQDDGLFYGGMGYDPPTNRPYADLSNSYMAYEAMYRTAHLEDLRTKGKTVSLDWEAAIDFVEHCHNDPDFNERSWAAADPAERGGFAYRPDTFRRNSGSYVKDDVVKFRSMPGMTYAGLLSYICAGVDQTDPRVQATIAWIRRNWQLEKGNRNPEMAGRPEEMEGLYYMYNVLAKGMNATGLNTLELENGETINWRDELIAKVTRLQHDEGYWVNEVSRYWEGNPVLVTAYSILALQSALNE